MTEKLTRIRVPDAKAHVGLMDWGECDDMIAQIRRHADWLREQVAAIDACADSDFEIVVVRGSVVQHHVRTIQAGRSRALCSHSDSEWKGHVDLGRGA